MLIGMKDSKDNTSGRVTAACVGQEVRQESEVLQVLPLLARAAEGWSCRVGFMGPGSTRGSPGLFQAQPHFPGKFCLPSCSPLLPLPPLCLPHPFPLRLGHPHHQDYREWVLPYTSVSPPEKSQV